MVRQTPAHPAAIALTAAVALTAAQLTRQQSPATVRGFSFPKPACALRANS